MTRRNDRQKKKGGGRSPWGSRRLTVVEVPDVELDLVRVLRAPAAAAAAAAPPVAVVLVLVVAAASVAVGRGHGVVPPASPSPSPSGAFGGAGAGAGAGSGTAVFGHCFEWMNKIYLVVVLNPPVILNIILIGMLLLVLVPI